MNAPALLTILVTTSANLRQSTQQLCINNILKKYPSNFRFMIMVNSEMNIQYPVLRVSELPGKNMFSNVRFDVFILDDKVFSIKSLIAWEVTRDYSNPKAVYIIMTSRVTKQLFRKFAKHYLTKIFVIHKPTNAIFTYNPYFYENLNDPVLTPLPIGDCSNEFQAVIYEHFPKQWRNTTLRDCYRVLFPYTTENDDGLENAFLELACKKLGMKRQSVSLPHRSEDTLELLCSEGETMLRNKNSDVLTGFNSPSEDTPRYFELSSAFYSDSIAWISPNASKISHWRRIAKIFSKKTLLCLVAATVVWIILVHGFHGRINILKVVLMAFQIFLEYGISNRHDNRRLSLRILLIGWILAFVIISCLFKNSLLIILGTETRDPKMLFTSNIVKSNMKVTSYIDLSSLYVDRMKQKELNFDFERISRCHSVLACVNKTAFERHTITTAPKAIVRYNWIPKYYINDQGEVLVVVSRDIIKPFFVHMIFTKGYPPFRQINGILNRMLASGWFNHAYNEMRMKIKRATNPLVFEAERIGMSKFEFVFIIWTFGMFLSFFTLCLEVLVYKKYIRIPPALLALYYR